MQALIEAQSSGVQVTNEPKRRQCGAPDYVVYKGAAPVGYIETKKIGAELGRIENEKQLKRYRSGLDNLVLTDYLVFWRYRYGERVQEVALAGVENKRIVAHPTAFDSFVEMLADFCAFKGQTIKSANRLAEIMAHKTKIMQGIFLNAVKEHDGENTLRDQWQTFREILIHDLSEEGFADMYAQTIAYGLFAARSHDTTLEDFSRQEAHTLLPDSNPFLQKLFGYIAGVGLDKRVVWIIDELCALFRATDIEAILNEYHQNTGRKIDKRDPYLHFYETFLATYNPRLRERSGVYYTPAPVVNFIVRAVDEILKREFGLPRGLADNSVIEDVNSGDKEARRDSVHRVQILDPATGTGTFIAEVIRNIYETFIGQQGNWSNYVSQHLVPRINGFELMMAPYAMCHLKLELLLQETGYAASDVEHRDRFKVYLTNTLEEPVDDSRTLFASWLSREARAANEIKNNTPIMVVMGNPPYSGESQNKSDYIMQLMQEYKKEPGGKEKLKERNPKWINDDYVKFIRYGQHCIDQKGEGILAYINNHSFLDNPTFRGMRWSLLTSFDRIYIIDLHGNSKKKETAPDGGPDKNVFDIQQGVSINLFIKTGTQPKDALAEVRHYDLYGDRAYKYHFLLHNNLSSIPFKKVPHGAPQYFMVPKDFSLEKKYKRGFSVTELFSLYSVGVVTGRDALYIHKDRKALIKAVEDYYHKIDTRLIKAISYRPFDTRYLYNNIKLIERNRFRVMRHFLRGENVGLIVARGLSEERAPVCFISEHIINCRVWTRPKSQSVEYIASLYLYPEGANTQETLDGDGTRTPNLNNDIVNAIAKKLGLPFVDEKEPGRDSFAPIDLLDYIYAVLHSPSYRRTYREFLKIDFPRVPYPTEATLFWRLVQYGQKLRRVHLLQDPTVEQYSTTFPIDGSNVVEKIRYTDNRVFLNDRQYFDGVPAATWDFYIGGYQPAQKWLKDRKNRALNFDDIAHYQKIIKALVESNRIMGEIEGVEVRW